MKTVSIVCQTTKTLTLENPESPVNKGFHEPNNTKMYNSFKRKCSGKPYKLIRRFLCLIFMSDSQILYDYN